MTSRDRVHPLYLLLVQTGLRRGEAIGLRWADVDLEQGQRVEQQIVAVGGERHVGPPKSSNGRRTVALPARPAEALRVARRQAAPGAVDGRRRLGRVRPGVHHIARACAGSGPGVAALRTARHRERPAIDPIARSTPHVGVAWAGQRGDAVAVPVALLRRTRASP